jgi:transcription termination/antitermination protein NusA
MMNLVPFVKNLFLLVFVIAKMGIYDKEIIDYINLFERVTRSRVKDCFYHNEILVFVVEEGYASKAIGKKGANISKFSALIKKRLKVVEYSEDPLVFIKNLVYPIKLKDVKLEGDTLKISAELQKDKGLLIGRDKRNLENFKKAMKSYFKIENVKVI